MPTGMSAGSVPARLDGSAVQFGLCPTLGISISISASNESLCKKRMRLTRDDMKARLSYPPGSIHLLPFVSVISKSSVGYFRPFVQLPIFSNPWCLSEESVLPQPPGSKPSPLGSLSPLRFISATSFLLRKLYLGTLCFLH